MRTIYKYTSLIDDEVVVVMPKDAKILHVGSQESRWITYWALIDTEEPVVSHRKFTIRGTGHNCDGLFARDHIGTVIDGPYVWHVFERTPL